MLSDGLVHRSEATLYAARAADWTPAARAALADLARCTGLMPPALP
jgi:ATP phosphoribosyltransferase